MLTIQIILFFSPFVKPFFQVFVKDAHFCQNHEFAFSTAACNWAFFLRMPLQSNEKTKNRGAENLVIEPSAFSDCICLTSVYYEGTAEEWSAITVGTHNDPLTSATRYYFSEEAPSDEGNYWHYDENGEIAVWQN